MITQIERGGIVTLTDAAAADAAQHADLWNDDLRPCTVAEHDWSARRFASLWAGMCLCIPTYSLASGMIALGMNWYEAVLTIFVGSAIVLIPILLVSHAGTRYGFPYPVFARLWFGTRGAHVPALARAIIGAGWFGINAWFGGLAIDAIVGHIFPLWVEWWPHTGVAFAAFWLINVAVATRGPQAIGRLASISAPTLAVAAIALFIWGASAMGSVPRMLAAPATLHGGAFWSSFVPSVIGVVAFWATLALNIPDYTRYATSQRAQFRGQLVMPFVMAIFAFIGIAVTSASEFISGKPLWNPVDLIVTFPLPVVIIGGLVVVLSSITINVGANVMAPARAFENLWPSHVNFALGAVATGLLSLLMQPWAVLASFHNYVFTWLGTYGTLLGPFDGIAIADYWLVRQLRLSLAELYSPSGRYDYKGGWNIRAIAALIVGWIPSLLGLVFEPLAFLWGAGWFFSIIVAGLAYALFMRTDKSRLNAAEFALITDEQPAAPAAMRATDPAIATP